MPAYTAFALAMICLVQGLAQGQMSQWAVDFWGVNARCMVPGSEAARGPRKKSLRAKSASSVAKAADLQGFRIRTDALL
jgi:hypothetical protein